MTPRPLVFCFGLLSLLALAACSGGREPAAEDAATSEYGEAQAPDEAPVQESDAAADTGLDAEVLAAVEAGLAAENEALAEMVEELAEAGDEGAQFAAIALGGMRDAALSTGPGAAGMSPEAYGRAKESVYDVLGALDMRAMMRKQMDEADTSGLDEATVAAMRKDAEALRDSVPDPYAAMPADLAEAFRAREARLMELRARNVGLLMKVASG